MVLSYFFIITGWNYIFFLLPVIIIKTSHASAAQLLLCDLSRWERLPRRYDKVIQTEKVSHLPSQACPVSLVKILLTVSKVARLDALGSQLWETTHQEVTQLLLGQSHPFPQGQQPLVWASEGGPFKVRRIMFWILFWTYKKIHFTSPSLSAQP